MGVLIASLIVGAVLYVIGGWMDRAERARRERELEAHFARQRAEANRRQEEFERELQEAQRVSQERQREREARPFTGRRQDWIIIAARDPRDFPDVRHRHADGEMVAARDETPTQVQALGESQRVRWIWRCRCGEHWSLERQ